jgi:hypothetical protein
MALNSMQDYDEVSGILKMSASFILYWIDEIRNWNTMIQLPIHNSWIPKIIIRNMVIEKTLYYYDTPRYLSQMSRLPYTYQNLGPSWSWSYGCWIYNYLNNQCLLKLKLWVQTPFMAKYARYNNMW